MTMSITGILVSFAYFELKQKSVPRLTPSKDIASKLKKHISTSIKGNCHNVLFYTQKKFSFPHTISPALITNQSRSCMKIFMVHRKG